MRSRRHLLPHLRRAVRKPRRQPLLRRQIPLQRERALLLRRAELASW
jgi:hypothetical protein